MCGKLLCCVASCCTHLLQTCVMAAANMWHGLSAVNAEEKLRNGVEYVWSPGEEYGDCWYRNVVTAAGGGIRAEVADYHV